MLSSPPKCFITPIISNLLDLVLTKKPVSCDIYVEAVMSDYKKIKDLLDYLCAGEGNNFSMQDAYTVTVRKKDGHIILENDEEEFCCRAQVLIYNLEDLKREFDTAPEEESMDFAFNGPKHVSKKLRSIIGIEYKRKNP